MAINCEITATIAGVLLAAGSSQRFGGNKLIESLRDGTPVAVAAARNLKAGTDRTLAVVRTGDTYLESLLHAEGLEIVRCPDADGGMGVSLACGVRAAAEASGWLIALADMPFIHRQTICGVARMIRAGSAIAAPACQGRRGHPVGFGRAYGHALMSLQGDAGAWELLRKHAVQIDLLQTNDVGIHIDIDNPRDLDSCRTNPPAWRDW